MYSKELETLTMEPHMWTALDKLLPTDEYRKIVLDYQQREFERMPRCKTLFGVCHNWTAGRCTSKCSCRNKCIC